MGVSPWIPIRYKFQAPAGRRHTLRAGYFLSPPCGGSVRLFFPDTHGLTPEATVFHPLRGLHTLIAGEKLDVLCRGFAEGVQHISILLMFGKGDSAVSEAQHGRRFPSARLRGQIRDSGSSATDYNVKQPCKYVRTSGAHLPAPRRCADTLPERRILKRAVELPVCCSVGRGPAFA
jgi:hypothetical protein